MQNYLITIIFLITVAISSGCILISYQLKDKYKFEFLSSLMYMQVFFFTFGFYAIWGQVLVKSFLLTYVSLELMDRITNILVYMGTPFLVFGWYMLIRFSRYLAGRGENNKLTIWYLTINTILLLWVGYLINQYSEFKPLTIIKYYYFTLNIICTLISSLYLIVHSNRSKLPKKHLRAFYTLLIGFTSLESILIYFYDGTSIYFALAFIFIYYLGSGFIAIYFRYFVNLDQLTEKKLPNLSLDEFFSKFEITNREKEIIVEIYNGLTNQQIADKLFISLQTVKDHSSRIYSKTSTQSRVQLIKILQDSFNG